MKAVSAHYRRHARQLARRYGEVEFEDVHTAFLPYLPGPGGRVADIGAGTGRDARALAKRGYDVVAVEPCAAMCREGQVGDRSNHVRWVDDALPELKILGAWRERFDFVLCSAVLMHIDQDRLPAALYALQSVTRPGAHVALSLRKPLPKDPPNVFHDHTFDQIERAARMAGARLIDWGVNRDQFGRGDTVWTWYVFQTAPDEKLRAIADDHRDLRSTS